MFIPTTRNEIETLGWQALDIILVTGDSYIDSPFIGVSMIGKILLNAGFRVGIIAQPDLSSEKDIKRLGEPELFWGVTGGCVDSMIANRTASGKKRKTDDYTPGGENTRRPDRAVIVYTNLIRQYFKNTVPVVLGGIEACLRRVAHYDFWSNGIRKSILFDAKATYLLYGMADRSILELATALKEKTDPRSIRGLCYIDKEKPEEALRLPSFDEVMADKLAFTEMFHLFYQNNDPLTARTLYQQQDARYLVQNPPARYLATEELDQVYGLDFERDLHPYYKRSGDVRALDTIRFSITTHRGCYGECNFCAISTHQGRTVRWRSEKSIIKEAEAMVSHPLFKGTILDAGGPTANMYGIECTLKTKKGSCKDKRCLFPNVCPSLSVNHKKQIDLLNKLHRIPGVKHVFVASGIRYDMILSDKKFGAAYLEALLSRHVSGQMKIAPEHTEEHVLNLMGKPSSDSLIEFKNVFDRLSKKTERKQFLTYYMIAAYPGCREKDMANLKSFATRHLKIIPRQIQTFTPSPSTYATLMYYTGKDPFSGKPLFVEKTFSGREKQKSIVLESLKKDPPRPYIRKPGPIWTKRGKK
ncbi:MAG: YgiQ family radical SAM protein [Proteobacteria bacterium]|nr:YgiQ family radical SAM protein [Pseudomonadota bacterium]